MRKKKKRFQVRFHLGKGPNYMCWQVKDYGLNPAANNGRPDTDYYAPSDRDWETFLFLSHFEFLVSF